MCWFGLAFTGLHSMLKRTYVTIVCVLKALGYQASGFTVRFQHDGKELCIALEASFP